jgi:pimeloyl-ACP methyl ester carboxylesterase
MRVESVLRFVVTHAAAAALMITLPASLRAETAVYLMRGLFDASAGLDMLAGDLRRAGHATRIGSYTDRDAFTAEAIRDAKNAKRCPVVVIGHSMGADAAVDMTEKLAEAGIHVALLVTFSPAYQRAVGPKVGRVVNYYQSNSTLWANRITAGTAQSPRVRNIDLAADNAVDHFNIERIPRIQRQVVQMVAAARGEPCAIAGGGARHAGARKAPVTASEPTKPE